MTDIIRSEAPRRPLGGLLARAGLAAGTLLFTVLSFLGVVFGFLRNRVGLTGFGLCL